MPARRQAAEEISRKKASEYALLSQVAHMYYDQHMLQPEIASRLYFSRSKVSRMLSRAIDVGIVEINVRRVFDRVSSLERQLCRVFGLADAVVISSFDDESDADAFESLSDFAALHISSLFEGDCTVGISNGRMVSAVVKKLHKVQPCSLEVIQLVGAVSNTFRADEARQSVEEMLESYSGRGYYLNAPLYLDDLDAKNVLLQNQSVQDVFTRMGGCDLLLTGIGGVITDFSTAPQWNGFLTEEHVRELVKNGAVGSICEQYFDLDGRLVPSRWNQNCIAIPFAAVRRCPMAIGIALGEEKVIPILGALRGGLLDCVVTNATTASRVLEEQRRLAAEDKDVPRP